ncbi:hypothetical protein Y032_0017g3390 [Ancylostoma ceylanicum]|uniref:Uncharacterized protein n=1 Tax=Ancylostoma ceylanicum TaxID=53326 RepID=A0A016V682_9BILA|nr:hypothetical protein Y032_0017g3390 [Ancylostoma ceylanicum]
MLKAVQARLAKIDGTGVPISANRKAVPLSFNCWNVVPQQWWFKHWIIEIYQKDPKKDKIEMCRNSIQEKLKRLLCNYYETPEELSTLKLNIPMTFVFKCQCYKSMENYFHKKEMHKLFQMCMLSTLSKNGNTQLTPFLRAALDSLNLQLLNRLESIEEENDADAENQSRMIGEESDLFNWMLTAEEKKEEQLRDWRDRVWEIAVQNGDYIQRSKAL